MALGRSIARSDSQTDGPRRWRYPAGVSLLWVVPAVAASVGLVVLLLRVRALEDSSIDLMVAMHRTGELRRPLEDVRSEMAHSEPLVDRVWRHWSDPPHDGDPEAKSDAAPGPNPGWNPDPARVSGSRLDPHS